MRFFIMSVTSEGLPVIARKRFLIVEDEVMMVFLLDEMLTILGYDIVATASSLDKALEKVETVSFDAAILDINLNGERSYTVADELQKKGTPFFFSTGYAQSSLPEGYRSIPTLQKPYHMDQLQLYTERLLNPENALLPVA